MRAGISDLTLGPVLFNWRPDEWRDFYFRIADEAPVAAVYLGEVVCAKRAPFFEPLYGVVAERLAAAGKQVVFSSLAQVMSQHDRRLVAGLCGSGTAMVEANDASALWHLAGRGHHVGPFLNVYNEDTLALLAARGARNVCLPVELPGEAIAALRAPAQTWNMTLEVQVFGRMPLALSARCYHARVHGRSKDSCQYVCEQDRDGLTLKTLDERAFLTINGVQTLSHDYLCLAGELPALQDSGVTRFRLSPHTCDMVAVAATYRDLLDGRIDAPAVRVRLGALGVAAPFVNGFFHHRPGMAQVARES